MDKLSYRKKFFGVMIISLVLFVLSWYRMINPLFHLIGECNRMEKELDSTMASSDELLKAKTELAELNEIIGNEEGLISQINRELISFVGEHIKITSATLTDFSPVHEYKSEDFGIYTHRLEIEGGFHSILKTLHKLENEFRQARVCSIQFYTKSELRTKKKFLYGVFYVQNIRRNA